jgi:hypothetical protein
MRLKEGGKLSYTVLRKNESGVRQEVELTADLKMVEREVKHLIGINEQATAEQVALRKSWLRE